MGGFGSGCFMRLHRRTKVEELWRFDYAELHRWGAFSGRPGFYRIEGREVAFIAEGSHLPFAWQEPRRIHETRISFTATATAFNGKRQWFCCPACHKPCRVLHSKRLSCRRCLDLRYASQSETRRWRASRKAQWIKRRLGGGGHDAPMPSKPPKMRWETYEALALRHALLEAEWIERTEKVLCWQRDSR